ncbi:hypothetical protein SLE2022_344020 [Rubroshorea leprosula]
MTCLRAIFKKKSAPPAEQTTEIDEEVSGIQNTTLFTYKELKVATGNFHPSNKIGQGGFGVVYRGTLRDGTEAAIKVLSADSKQGVKEFLTEIKIIADIVHENLVKLYGCCVEGKHRILVYGYLENNSLTQTLLGGRRSNIQFSWQTRCNICIGVAKGLAFLHEEVRPHIIHRDIKASNVLLDKNLMPKISDFGLAKLFPDDLTHISTHVAGTVGYLAPEYAIQAQLTRKADIYSFGVLLLEIVSGRSHTDRRLPVAEQYLLEKAWELYESGKLMELVDTSLNGEYNAEEALRYLKIGLICTQDKPTLRPRMSKVVKMLTGDIELNNQEITRPGLLSDFMFLRADKGRKGNMKNSSYAISEGTSRLNSSSLPDNMNTSFATMTFTTIDERSD